MRRSPLLCLLAVVLPSMAAADEAKVAPSFANDVVPALSRLGCNSGACHGKLAGQNGFKLSLRGFAPELDYTSITREARGRRIAKSRPRDSLLLAKPTMRVPHKGGKALAPGTPEYTTLLAWVAAGAPGPVAGEIAVAGITVEPASAAYKPGEKRGLKVVARYTDGSARDVTRLSLFKANEEGVATVDEHGEVVARRPGSTAVMAIYQGQVAAHVVTTPYDANIDDNLYVSRHNYIDDHVMSKLREIRLEPSAPADDPTFLRRAYLDLTGSLPEPEAASAFLADASDGKRHKLVEELLASAAFVDYWASFLGELMQNRQERDQDKRGRKGVRGLAIWLREQVREDRPWDAVVRDVLTARGPLGQEPAGGYFLVNRKPEDLAEAATHAFLGTRLQCAKCHNHPLERFTQEDYYGMAAFFTRVKTDGKQTDEGPAVDVGVPGRRGREGAKTDGEKVGVSQPRTGQFLPPRPLDRTEITLRAGQDPREALADWMTSRRNPLFARAIVNRVWKRFLAVGLVEPVDDLRATNPATDEPLLDALCADFVAHNYDLKHLMRTIVDSRTYQLASDPTPGNAVDRKFYSHYYPRRLGAEVLADALSQATGVAEPFEGYAVGLRAVQLPDPRVQSYLLDTFGRPERVTACACERSDEVTMPQVLHLMNGEALDRRIDAPEGRLGALLASGKPDVEVVETLFLATFARRPGIEQRRTVESALAGVVDRRAVYRDLLWALVNSKEFLFGH